MSVVLCQINPTVGNIKENSELIINYVKKHYKKNNIYVFPEMCLTGYPTEDLVLRKSFQNQVKVITKKLCVALTKYDCYVVFGTLGIGETNLLYNQLLVLKSGRIIGKYNKHFLPNYGVFDEYRVFAPGTEPLVLTIDNKRFGFAICEDVWDNSIKLGVNSPINQYKEIGIDALIVINGSVFEKGKLKKRYILVRKRAKELGNIKVYYSNLYGGQDDLIFDGNSFSVNKNGKIQNEHTETIADIYKMCVLGLKDYVEKNNFKSVVLGLSGGIDSALCCTIAKDAVGAKNVYGVIMPSKFSSDHSVTDAKKLANNLGINLLHEPINDIFEKYTRQIKMNKIATENIQARIRANILMAHSNTYNSLLIATGNKSELAVGYSTIYGDAAGGYAPIKDIYKTDVFKLAKYRNTISKVIPKNSITKEPSAELSAHQKDTDTLPEYKVLDKILYMYIEQGVPILQICKSFDKKIVHEVVKKVDSAEWKRRQYPIGPKISSLAFGRDRRLPIANKFAD